MTTRISKPDGSAGASYAAEERRRRNRAAIKLLQSWLDADEEEIQDQRETLDVLRKGIDEERARLGMRLIFSE